VINKADTIAPQMMMITIEDHNVAATKSRYQSESASSFLPLLSPH
jgi:hypothetical protein